MNRPERRRIPGDIWKGIVRYGITPSINLVINDGTGSFLFLERGNEPAMGHLWVPGGRIRNSETSEQAVHRLAEEEIGLLPGMYDLLHVSDRHNEEIFPVAAMDPTHAAERYGPEVEYVHYWGGMAYLMLQPGTKPEITLDDQSKGYTWLRELPMDPHEYLVWYFQIAHEAGFSVPKLPEGK
jgi:ADP-ribose pyrophosphatase YjhB (NUDIX family)